MIPKLLYEERSVISRITLSTEKGVENGTIRLVIDTTGPAYLLHEAARAPIQ
jgi:hypothetical protein